jgi:hypothetical protein
MYARTLPCVHLSCNAQVQLTNLQTMYAKLTRQQPQTSVGDRSYSTWTNEPKNAALLGPECELPDDFPIRRGAIYDGPMGRAGNLVGYGIVCVGVPIGDAPFISRFLELKETSKYILFCKITINLVQIPDDCSSS